MNGVFTQSDEADEPFSTARTLDRGERVTYKTTEFQGKIVTMTTQRMPLPESLPVFPLTGVLLLPETVLPLHIFEPRYRNMVEDALNTDSIFGMIQPFVPQQDNRPLPGAEKDTPELYKVGCAGHVERYERSPDGRFFIQLKGVNRFRFEEELPLHRGYRRVRAMYQEFPDGTAQENWHCERQAILEALSQYGRSHGMQVQADNASRFTDVELVNLLAVSLPFYPAEKQALLEAPSVKDRETILINLLRLGTDPSEADSDIPSRTVN